MGLSAKECVEYKEGEGGREEGGRTRQKEDSDAKNIKVQEYKSTLTGGAVETQTYNDKVSITLHNGVYSEWAHMYTQIQMQSK